MSEKLKGEDQTPETQVYIPGDPNNQYRMNEDEFRKEIIKNIDLATPEELAMVLKWDYAASYSHDSFDAEVVNEYLNSVHKISEDLSSTLRSAPEHSKHFSGLAYQVAVDGLNRLREKKDYQVLELMQKRDEVKDKDYDKSLEGLRKTISDALGE